MKHVDIPVGCASSYVDTGERVGCTFLVCKNKGAVLFGAAMFYQILLSDYKALLLFFFPFFFFFFFCSKDACHGENNQLRVSKNFSTCYPAISRPGKLFGYFIIVLFFYYFFLVSLFSISFLCHV